MTFEIVGSRVLAPFLGSSTYVWSAIIGIILLAMSLGYAYGGKQADKDTSPKTLGRNIFLAAIALLVMNLAKNAFLGVLNTVQFSLILKSILASIVLFTIPSFFMATVLPFVVRLALNKVDQSGALIGRFYAISTIGSILGTFAGAIFFIPLLGTTQIMWVLASILIVCSLICYKAIDKSSLVLGLFLVAGNIAYSFRGMPYQDVDTEYNRVWIYDTEDEGTTKRYMMLNGHVNSGMDVQNTRDNLIIAYTEYYRLIEHFTPSFEKVLMLGGGAYSFPKYFQSNYPNKQLDVVEIDGELTQLSKDHFDFEPNQQLQLFHEDARTFLARSESKYDAILMDVFSSDLSVPFQLTTIEAFELVKNRLDENGVLIINLLGSEIEGRSHFLQSEVKTLQQLFQNVDVLAVQKEAIAGKKNYMIIAADRALEYENENPELSVMLRNKMRFVTNSDGRVMTDNYAPANWMLIQ